MVEMLNSATGFNYTSESYLTTGERIWNLTRKFNTREGISALDDVLPERFYKETMPEGSAKGQRIKPEELEVAKAKYYKLRGWTSQGLLTEEKMKQLRI